MSRDLSVLRVPTSVCLTRTLQCFRWPHDRQYEWYLPSCREYSVATTERVGAKLDANVFSIKHWTVPLLSQISKMTIDNLAVSSTDTKFTPVIICETCICYSWRVFSENIRSQYNPLMSMCMVVWHNVWHFVFKIYWVEVYAVMSAIYRFIPAHGQISSGNFIWRGRFDRNSTHCMLLICQLQCWKYTHFSDGCVSLTWQITLRLAINVLENYTKPGKECQPLTQSTADWLLRRQCNICQ